MIIERYPKYQIFKDGSIQRFGKVLKPRINNCGYWVVFLYHNKKRRQEFVHKLLLEAFKPNTIKSFNQGNHINGIKTDNSLDNLEWCDNSHNQKHAYKLGLHKSNSNWKIDNTQSQVIRDCYNIGLSVTQMSKYFKVSGPCVKYHVQNKQRYYVLSEP